MSVLVVDDDPILIDLVAEVLDDEGIIVSVVSTIEGAIDAVATRAPSLVLLDQHLPDGGGLANVRALKAAGVRPPAVLLFSAGQMRQSDVLAAGADGFIPKPFELSDFVTKISQWLQREVSGG